MVLGKYSLIHSAVNHVLTASSNKYRAIVKTLEEEGAVWAKPASTNGNTAPKAKANKRNASLAGAKGDTADDDGEEPPVKKSKAAAKKGVDKPVKKEKKSAVGKAKKAAATKKEASDDEGDVDMDDGMTNAGSIPGPTLSEAEGVSGDEEA